MSKPRPILVKSGKDLDIRGDVPLSRADVGMNQLHRELIEARNLAIKTDNLVKNLGADLKQIAKRQDSYQAKYIFNSAVAYILFVALISTGLYLAFDAKLSGAEDEVAHFKVRNRDLQERLADVEAELDRRREAEARAYAFYELLENGNPDEVVEQFNEVQTHIADRAMVELLRDRVGEINYDLAEQAFRQGHLFIQEENWSDARDSFLKSFNHLERAPWAPELHYYIGYALYSLEDFQGAIHYFDRSLDYEELDSALQAWAMYRRGMSLKDTGQLTGAITQFREFRDEHPNHRYAGRALGHINRMQRELDRAADDDD